MTLSVTAAGLQAAERGAPNRVVMANVQRSTSNVQLSKKMKADIEPRTSNVERRTGRGSPPPNLFRHRLAGEFGLMRSGRRSIESAAPFADRRHWYASGPPPRPNAAADSPARLESMRLWIGRNQLRQCRGHGDCQNRSALKLLKPDIVLIVGDRVEAFAARRRGTSWRLALCPHSRRRPARSNRRFASPCDQQAGPPSFPRDAPAKIAASNWAKTTGEVHRVGSPASMASQSRPNSPGFPGAACAGRAASDGCR